MRGFSRQSDFDQRLILGAAAVLLLSGLPARSQSEAPAQYAEYDDGYFQASDGVRIHYLRAGDQGSWVVLIHGYTDSGERMFFSTGIAPALARNHRVVAIDNRNHGLSDKPEPNGTGRAEDVIELMDHLGIDRAHIHGYSMGGGITATLLGSHPGRFITAGFGGSGIRETDPELREKAEAMDTPMPEPEGREAEAFARLRAAALARSRAAALARSRAAAASRTPAREDSVPAARTEIDLTQVMIPVFAINGEFDSPHAKTERMVRELADFTNVIIPGKNHIGAVVGPMPLYVESIVEFIDAHDAD